MVDKIQIDELWIEDALYVSIIRSMVMTYSCPKVNVWGNPIEDCFDIHIVFPNASVAGVIIDTQLPIEKIHGKRFSEVEDVLCDLVRNIKADVQAQIELDKDRLEDDNEE